MHTVQPLRIVLSGQLLTYLLANAYTIAGGLLGSPPGGEMRAAARAAEEVSRELSCSINIWSEGDVGSVATAPLQRR